jgi:MFS family permease
VLRLLTASALSSFGDGVQLIAFPLAGAALTDSPAIIAALAATGSAPALIGALPAGGLIDRVRRARLMVGLDLARCAVLAALVALIATGRLAIWHLFVIAVLMGLGALFFDLSAQAVVPSVVPAAGLTTFNGTLASTRELADGLIGPAVAGFLYAAATGLPFAVNALTFLISAALLARLASAEAPAPSSRKAPIRAGLRTVFHDRPLTALFLVIATAAFFGNIPEATLVLYAKQELALGSVGFGALFAVTSAGAVLGGLAAARFVTSRNAARVVIPAQALYLLCLVPPAFLASPIAVGAVFFLQGLPILVFSVGSATIRQLLIPRELMGRVSAVFYLAGAGITPLGLLAGGLIADRTGLRATFLIGAAGMAVSLAVVGRPLRGFDTRLRALAT